MAPKLFSISLHQCVVPENILPPSPTEWIGIFWGVGVWGLKAKTFQEVCEALLEFPHELGGEVLEKSLLWGRYEYFLELHNASN